MKCFVRSPKKQSLAVSSLLMGHHLPSGFLLHLSYKDRSVRENITSAMSLFLISFSFFIIIFFCPPQKQHCTVDAGSFTQTSQCVQNNRGQNDGWRPWALREFHETCHSVTFIVVVNSHQRWKQTRNRICFHLWRELTLAMWCHSIVWSLLSWIEM